MRVEGKGEGRKRQWDRAIEREERGKREREREREREGGRRERGREGGRERGRVGGREGRREGGREGGREGDFTPCLRGWSYITLLMKVRHPVQAKFTCCRVCRLVPSCIACTAGHGVLLMEWQHINSLNVHICGVHTMGGGLERAIFGGVVSPTITTAVVVFALLLKEAGAPRIELGADILGPLVPLLGGWCSQEGLLGFPLAYSSGAVGRGVPHAVTPATK